MTTRTEPAPHGSRTTSGARRVSVLPSGRERGGPAVVDDRSLLRIGAVAGMLGVVLQVALDRLHPPQADPNDSLAAFREYAGSSDWTAVHLGQYLDVLLIALALVGITLLALGLATATGRLLPRWLGWAGALAGAGFVAGGTLTAHTGSSGTSGTVLLPATALSAVFLLGACLSMWRRSSAAP